MNQDHKGLLVVGAGQMRTGTMSLKLALQRLYGGKCYHMDNVLFEKKDHVHLWIKAFDQGYLDKELSEKIFKGYVCAVDNPVAPFYKDLMRIHPNSKIILTTRDPNDWVKSVRNTTCRKATFSEQIMMKITLWCHGISAFPELRSKIFFKAYGHKYEILENQDAVLKSSFEAYNEEVRRTVPKERLLEFSSKEGWGPLCKFLNVPVPDEPFPYANTTTDFHNSFKSILFHSILKCGVFISVVLASGIYIYKRWPYLKG